MVLTNQTYKKYKTVLTYNRPIQCERQYFHHISIFGVCDLMTWNTYYIAYKRNYYQVWSQHSHLLVNYGTFWC